MVLLHLQTCGMIRWEILTFHGIGALVGYLPLLCGNQTRAGWKIHHLVRWISQLWPGILQQTMFDYQKLHQFTLIFLECWEQPWDQWWERMELQQFMRELEISTWDAVLACSYSPNGSLQVTNPQTLVPSATYRLLLGQLFWLPLRPWLAECFKYAWLALWEVYEHATCFRHIYKS